MLSLFSLEQLESLLCQPGETEIEKVKDSNGIPSLLGKEPSEVVQAAGTRSGRQF